MAHRREPIIEVCSESCIVYGTIQKQLLLAESGLFGIVIELGK
jgi:hypothetical protein